MKCCLCCGEQLTLEEFYVDRTRADGRARYCKRCAKIKVAAARAKRLEHYRAVARQYARAHPSERRAGVARWRERNPERAREAQRAWAERNQSAEVARAHRRRGVCGDPAYLKILAGDPCSYCNASGETADHIVPVAVGGDGSWLNLTAACRSCNSSKWKHSLLHFMLSVRPDSR